MNYKKILTILFVSISCVLYAQDTIEQNVYNEKYKFSSLIKARYINDVETGENRFEIRNARVEMKGRANRYVGYNLQVDLSDKGVFKVLDLAVKLFPTENIDISIGQVAIPYATYKVTSPFQVLCSDLPLPIAFVGPQPRDIGFNIGYVNNDFGFPVFLQGGVYNGATINEPRTENTLAYSLRASFGDIKKFRIGAKMYNATNYRNTSTDITTFGFDMNTNFLDKKLTFDVEWDCRYTYAADSIGNRNKTILYGTYAELAYKHTTSGKIIHYLMPVVKWDALTNEDFSLNSDVNRLTFGLNLGFDPIFRKMELRFNYEKFFLKNNAHNISRIDAFDWQDKVILEFLLRF